MTVSVQDQPDGSVKITASRDGVSMEATDAGVDCAPLAAAASAFAATTPSCGSPESWFSLWMGCRACVESSLSCTAEPSAALPTVATLWIG